MSHLSNLQLDALRTGNASAPDRDAAEAHLSSCARCSERRDALAAKATAFADTFDARSLAIETLSRVESRSKPAGRPAWQWWSMPRLAGAAAAVLLVAGAVLLSDPDEDTHRLKGAGAAVELFVVVEGAPRPLGPEGVVPNSRLRLRFDPGAGRYARFLWRDESGRLVALYPAADAGALELGPSGARWLKREIELDDAAATEWLHAVFCDEPFGHSAAVRAKDGCTEMRLEVKKR